VHHQVEGLLDRALLMQTWLLGDGHPSVTDTLMISVRMLLAQQQHALAVPMLERVWQIRTGFDGTECLALGHAREVESSLLHLGRTSWLQGDMLGANILLEGLLRSSERHLRDAAEVHALLAMTHLQCHSNAASTSALDVMQLRIGLVAQVVQQTNVRPLSLVGSRFGSSDVQKREGALVPDTMRPVWKAVAMCLALNALLQELDLGDCDIGSGGMTQLSAGLIGNSSLHTLGLSSNKLGVKSGASLEQLLRNNCTITLLDLSSNGLQDQGIAMIGRGIAGTLVFNTSLRSLKVRDNSITVDGALSLAGALKMETVGLAALDISLNPLGSEGASHIVDVVFLGGPMVTLVMSDCQIGLEGVVKIAEAVEASTSLCFLCLSNERKQVLGGMKFSNEIDGMGASLLAHALEQSYTLTRLDLSGCQIGVKGLQALGEVLKPVNYTRSAPDSSVDYMGIVSSWEQRALFAATGTRGALRSLALSTCLLGPEGAEALKHVLLRNPALVGLDLNQSGIMGTGVAHICVALGANPKYHVDSNTTLTSLNLQVCLPPLQVSGGHDSFICVPTLLAPTNWCANLRVQVTCTS